MLKSGPAWNAFVKDMMSYIPHTLTQLLSNIITQIVPDPRAKNVRRDPYAVYKLFEALTHPYMETERNFFKSQNVLHDLTLIRSEVLASHVTYNPMSIDAPEEIYTFDDGPLLPMSDLVDEVEQIRNILNPHFQLLEEELDVINALAILEECLSLVECSIGKMMSLGDVKLQLNEQNMQAFLKHRNNIYANIAALKNHNSSALCYVLEDRINYLSMLTGNHHCAIFKKVRYDYDWEDHLKRLLQNKSKQNGGKSHIIMLDNFPFFRVLSYKKNVCTQSYFYLTKSGLIKLHHTDFDYMKKNLNYLLTQKELADFFQSLEQSGSTFFKTLEQYGFYPADRVQPNYLEVAKLPASFLKGFSMQTSSSSQSQPLSLSESCQKVMRKAFKNTLINNIGLQCIKLAGSVHAPTSLKSIAHNFQSNCGPQKLEEFQRAYEWLCDEGILLPLLEFKSLNPGDPLLPLPAIPLHQLNLLKAEAQKEESGINPITQGVSKLSLTA